MLEKFCNGYDPPVFRGRCASFIRHVVLYCPRIVWDRPDNLFALLCLNGAALFKQHLVIPILIHWGRDKIDVISQTTFSSAFSSMKMFEFRLKFSWSVFLRFQLTIMAWRRPAYLVYWRIYASRGLNELKHIENMFIYTNMMYVCLEFGVVKYCLNKNSSI